MKRITTNSAEETKKWAKQYAQSLRGGEVIGLIGDLGAGKTTFCQGLAKGLGITQNVNSPTFVIMKIYPVNNASKIKNLVHIDAYRLESANDLESIGAKERFERDDTVILIEWADNISSFLPKKTTNIIFKQSGEERILEIKKRCC